MISYQIYLAKRKISAKVKSVKQWFPLIPPSTLPFTYRTVMIVLYNLVRTLKY